MCGRITRSTVESKNNEPSVDVGTMSNEILILSDVASGCGLNLIVAEFQSALNASFEEELVLSSVPFVSKDVTTILYCPNTSPVLFPYP
jgi:hypothetical protein